MSFALLGVMAMQYYFIKESYSLKSQLFDQAVNDALKNVSIKLEKKEAMAYLTKKAETEIRQREEQLIRKNQSEASEQQIKNLLAERKKYERDKQIIDFVKRMKANQAKSDSVFRIRDSLLRSRYPHKLVYNGPAIADNAPFSVNVKIDVDEVVDQYGNIRLVQRQSLLETPAIPNHIRIVKRGVPVIDSVRKYMVQDPVLGTVLKTIAKPNFLTLARFLPASTSSAKRPTKYRRKPSSLSIK